VIIATLHLRRIVLSALAWSLVASMTTHANAAPITYRIDRDATQVEYVARALGVIEARGRFTDVRGSIVLDREIAQGDIDFEIDARSVDSGWMLRDAFVRGEPMLDATHHPLIRFRSSHVTFVDGRLTGIEGLLTLRGVTRHIALVVTQIACDGRSNGESTDCAARAVADIKRGAFGMESYAPWVGDDVELSFVVVAHRVPETVTGP